ncbi:DUF2975 domain-containing protein [Hymenobacter norwichensis]|uniref:DUF2975 domain-containing protein n=1 Tax=Hymenobacter norwichensis TaxID=223903 RepID=UPI00146C6E26|nr:DUF2975 domain-containing protein [Hymenobacter norwichensis]
MFPSSPKADDIVSVNVRQHLPSTSATIPSVTIAKEEVAAGKPTQLIMHAQTGTLVLREPQASRRLLVRIINAEKGPLPLMLAGLIFSFIMAAILNDVKPGVPFSPANTRRLYWLAALFIGCEVYQRAAFWWMQHYLHSVTPPGIAELTPNSEFSSSLVSNGLVAAMLVILAASYRRGVQLAEEAELTV